MDNPTIVIPILRAKELSELLWPGNRVRENSKLVSPIQTSRAWKLPPEPLVGVCRKGQEPGD